MENNTSKKGKLKVKVIEADLSRDTEWFSKMDPFCKIIYNNKENKTVVKDEAGKTPKWN